MRHHLKSWPEYFEAVRSGGKTFEVRFHDRDFQVGHMLDLHEWDPDTKTYTGRSTHCVITYIMRGGVFGIEEGYVVLGIAIVGPSDDSAGGLKIVLLPLDTPA